MRVTRRFLMIKSLKLLTSEICDIFARVSGFEGELNPSSTTLERKSRKRNLNNDSHQVVNNSFLYGITKTDLIRKYIFDKSFSCRSILFKIGENLAVRSRDMHFPVMLSEKNTFNNHPLTPFQKQIQITSKGCIGFLHLLA